MVYMALYYNHTYIHAYSCMVYACSIGLIDMVTNVGTGFAPRTLYTLQESGARHRGGRGRGRRRGWGKESRCEV